MQELLFLSIPPLGIIIIYCVWKRYFHTLVRKARKQRQGIAEMLWTMANQVKTKTIRRPK